MSKIKINGGKKLFGEIDVQGAKNSVLPVLAATILCEGECVIHNCPNLSDVQTSIKILKNLGCECNYEDNTVTVNSSNICKNEIPDDLMREMRSSIVFLGAIISRCGEAKISSPGGCELGPRPIDLHLASLKKMGVSICEKHGLLDCVCESKIVGATINLCFPSVGATENIILAAAKANGVTVINNAAKEPEISDLADFLNSAGARIYGAGSDTVIIQGVNHLHGTTHTIIPDRIVAATYMAAAAMNGGRIKLNNVMPSNMVSLFWAFNEAGCAIVPNGKSIIINSTTPLKRIPTVRSLVYPGFPTDAGPILIAMLCLAKGTSVFVENIFENRYKYVDELKRFGAKIKTEGKVAVIEGVNAFSAASVRCTDLRGGAALVLAGLVAKGETIIGDIHHIERGYDDIVAVLSGVGAEIEYVKG